jgi:ammonium transporter, Amt family
MAIDTGNTAFMLLCASLVMLMTPGLAFFYGGLVELPLKFRLPAGRV